MNLKEYLYVKAEDINIIRYIFTDKDVYGYNDDYSKPNSIAIGGESGTIIFEKNGVPKKYQMVFMECNRISLELSNLFFANKKNIYGPIIPSFKAKEYLTDTVLYLNNSKYGPIYGRMEGNHPSFEVHQCDICEKEDIILFFKNLREEGLLDNYLKSLGELMNYHIKSNFNSKCDKNKNYTKTKNS